jgi:hypothetical protein
MLRATQPPERGMDLQPPDPEIQMPPDRLVFLTVLPMPCRVGTLRAIKTTTAQSNRDHDPIGLEANLLEPTARADRAGERMQR